MITFRLCIVGRNAADEMLWSSQCALQQVCDAYLDHYLGYL